MFWKSSSYFPMFHTGRGFAQNTTHGSNPTCDSSCCFILPFISTRTGLQILEVQTADPAPFAKLTHPNLRTIDNKPIPLRIDVNNHDAVFNARFVKTYVAMVSRYDM